MNNASEQRLAPKPPHAARARRLAAVAMLGAAMAFALPAHAQTGGPEKGQEKGRERVPERGEKGPSAREGSRSDSGTRQQPGVISMPSVAVNPSQQAPAAQAGSGQGHGGAHGHNRAAPPTVTLQPPARGHWYDGGHSHNRSYPAAGYVVQRPHAHWHSVYWGGNHYRFWDGVWYSPWNSSWVVVRPPFGLVLWDVPAWFTPVTVAGSVYLYANGVYYRNRFEGGYEVVAPPVANAAQPAPVQTAVNRIFVYPRNGQTPQQQVSDEFECHRWAASQSGYDPLASAGVATTPATSAPAPAGAPAAPGVAVRVATGNAMSDYERARAACLEGRGYTVR